MNFLRISTISVIILFLSIQSIHTQNIIIEKQMETKHYKYGDTITLKINEKIQFQDGLSITLTDFSHKLPEEGMPTKATAYITLTRANLSDEIMLSKHEGMEESQSEDDLYENVVWKEYKFQLKYLDYDKSIKIIIYKNE